MALTKILTEAHWKANGLPKRSMGEKLKQKKTGISEALRAAEAADKALMLDILNGDLAKKMSKALDVADKALKDLKAEDKELMRLRAQMVAAIADHRTSHNDLIDKINRDNMGGIPGGIKMLRKQAEVEFSSENQTFIEEAMKVSADPVKIIALMVKMVDQINITNAPKWKALIQERDAWEKNVKLQLKTSLTNVVSAQGDTVLRLKAAAKI